MNPFNKSIVQVYLADLEHQQQQQQQQQQLLQQAQQFQQSMGGGPGGGQPGPQAQGPGANTGVSGNAPVNKGELLDESLPGSQGRAQ